MSSWLAVAVLAPLCWALVNLVDVYFVDRVYRDEYDGVVISGLAMGLPWIAVPFLGMEFPGLGVGGMAMAGGALFLLSALFYFRALQKGGDAAEVEVLNLTTALFAGIAGFFLGKEVSAVEITGGLVVLAGGALFSFRKGEIRKILPDMTVSVLALSASMVIEGEVYEVADFWSVYLFFALGAVSSVPAYLWKRRDDYGGRGILPGIAERIQAYPIPIIAAEGLAVLAITASQAGIAMAPSPALVAAVEALQPVFVIGLSVPFLASAEMRGMARRQIGNPVTKVIATMIMGVGVYLIS